MSELGRGRYRLYRSARITPADDPARILWELDSWALRGEYETSRGTLASVAPVSQNPTRAQVDLGRRKCRRSALDLYQSTP